MLSRSDHTTPPWVHALHRYWADDINHDHRCTRLNPDGECRVWKPVPSYGRGTENDYWSNPCTPHDGPGYSYYRMFDRVYPRPSEFKFRQNQSDRKARAKLRNAKHLAKQVRDFDEFEDWDLPGPRHRHGAAWLIW